MRGYLLGKYEPTIENLIKIAQACNVNVGWLADGEGEETTASVFLGQPNGEANPKLNDYLGKTARIITSKTIYRSALERNIDAFHKAVEMEDEMQGVKEDLRQMREEHRTEIEELKEMIRSLGGCAAEKKQAAN